VSVVVEREGAITVITLDRPDVRNAVDGPTAAALADAFRSFDADDGVAVAILTGAGGTFCAGADLRGSSGHCAPALASSVRPHQGAFPQA
jgi:enoyl-CoA hydratase